MSLLQITAFILLCSTLEIAAKFPVSTTPSLCPKKCHSDVENLAFNLSCNDLLACLDSKEYSCPPGLFCKGGHCECGVYPDGLIICNGTASSIMNCNCVSYNETRNIITAGSCIFGCGRRIINYMHPIYNPTPENISHLNNMTCEPLNRTGALCGRCLPDHYPLAYSFNLTCIPCPHVKWNWFRYIMAAYLPLTLFYIFVIFFNINITSSRLHAVIIFCQAVSLPVLLRVVLIDVQNNAESTFFIIGNVLLSLYGIWNLDFFRLFYSDICLGIDILPTLALDYVIAVYPLFLMIISYLLIVLHDKNYRVITIVWRPFRVLFSLFRRNWDIKTSVIDAFATFFLLSNIKFLNVSFDLLVPTKVYELHEDHYNYTLGLYYAADIKYLGTKHLPYAILAILTLIVFVILPVFILTVYPFGFFQKLLNFIPVPWHILHTFVDSFQGCYKNGTEPGARDCRWFSIVYFLCWFLLFVAYGSTLTLMFFAIGAFVLMLLTVLIIAVKPFKSSLAHHGIIHAVFFQFLGLLFFSVAGISLSSVYLPQVHHFLYIFAFIIVSAPLLYAVILILSACITKVHFGFVRNICH